MSSATTEQLMLPLEDPDYAPGLSIDDRYRAWIAANPWVLDVLEQLVGEWLAAGHERVGIKSAWEVLRWSYGRTQGDTFKANNSFTSRAARDLIARRPEWADAIELRALRAA